MRSLSASLMVAAAATILHAQAPLSVESLTLAGPPHIVAELDMGKLKGEPARLAWSPDATEFYLQTLEGGFGRPGAKRRHYLYRIATGARRDLPIEPDWASAYWTAKSGQAAPDDPSLKIELGSEKRLERTINVPRGGDLAKGGPTGANAGTPMSDPGVAAAFNSQQVATHTMRLKGEIVGQFENTVIVPGLTFGWGPPGSKAIAFAAQKSGRIVIMDARGEKREVPATKDALLPAWSPDGTRIAWLERTARRRFVLKVLSVS